MSNDLRLSVKRKWGNLKKKIRRRRRMLEGVFGVVRVKLLAHAIKLKERNYGNFGILFPFQNLCLLYQICSVLSESVACVCISTVRWVDSKKSATSVGCSFEDSPCVGGCVLLSIVIARWSIHCSLPCIFIYIVCVQYGTVQ